jgi:putative ABC transport system permease protein
LVVCVALCAALVVAIRCAIASLNAGLDQRINDTLGAAELRLEHPGKAGFDGALVEAVRAWPEVRLAVPRLIDALALANPRTLKSVRTIAYGVDPASERALRGPVMREGAYLPEVLGGPAVAGGVMPVVLDARTAGELDARVGDILEVQRFGSPASLRVVGIAKPPPLSALFKNQYLATLTLEDLGRLVERPGQVQEIDIVLARGQEPEVVAARHRATLPGELLLQATAKITSGFKQQQEASQVGMLLASIVAFLAAGFIISTGMTTAVAEKTRELSILRSIGATRGQLAATQLLTGVLVGLTGSALGVPIGLLGSLVLVELFPDQLPAGFIASPAGIASGVVGAVFAGAVGAGYSAWIAARVTPLSGLATRAKPTRAATLVRLALIGLGLMGVQAALVASQGPLSRGVLEGTPLAGLAGLVSAERFFWVYAPIGVPCMLVGYFLLSVPLTRLVAAGLAPVLGRVLGLPGVLLDRSMARTPVRHGLTAGSMMLGLSMLVSIWTNGASVLDRWFSNLQFPDAFVTGLSLRPDTAQRVERVPGVAHACPITLYNVQTDAFGIAGLTSYRTTFVAFEPAAFFAMTQLTWVQGELATAKAELQRGGAVLVAREFFVTRGLGLGDTITLRAARPGTREATPHTFRIVGVVTSPGLDIASKFFDIGENYVDQAVNSVFGTRADMLSLFGNDSVNLVQIAFAPGADPEATMQAIRRLPRTGILAGGTATAIKDEVRSFLTGTLRVFSLVAVAAMVIASLGVANVIVAGVRARSFEFGVLRASGATRGTLTRLVLGEALIVGVAAAILGTALGLQGAWGGQQVTTSSIGIEVPIDPPWPAVGLSVVCVVVITLAAALPPALALGRAHVRDLLATRNA